MMTDRDEPITEGLDPTARQPKPFWRSGLDVNLRKLFEGLTLACVHWKTGMVKSLGGDLIKVAGAISFKEKSPEEKAWKLTFVALTEALEKHTQIHVKTLLLSGDEDPVAFAKSLKLPSLEDKIVFDASFFEDPGQSPFFGVVRCGYQRWLEGAGMSQAEAALVAERLGTTFTFALHREWIANSARYASLLDWLDSPFTQAVDSKRRWLAYYNWLEHEYNQSVFGESYSLRDLYIPLNAYYETRDRESHTKVNGGTGRAAADQGGDEEAPITRHVVPLEEYLNSWLAEPKPDYPLLLISGGPGSGKSSFLKHFAVSLGRRERSVFFIPLQYLEFDRQISIALEAYVRRHPILEECVDLSGRSELVLLFDGLDELSMTGVHGLEAARDFVGALKEFLNRVNGNCGNIRAILSGRTLSIQADRSYGRDEGQVLHLLPYLTPVGARKAAVGERGFIFDDPQKLLDHDYRRDWWARLRTLMDAKNGGVPDMLLKAPFDALTIQPLLNVLIAISMSGPAEEALQIDEKTNLNHVYAHLLHRVWKRNDERGINRISEADFNAAMEGVAVATWHGNGRTADVEAIQKQVDEGLLQEFSEEAESSVYSLLVGFFFQGGGRNSAGQSVYEFTHKSFGEYLTARSLFALLRDILDEHERWKQNSRKGWDIQACLVRWLEHCGPAEMDGDLLGFVKREATLQCGVDALDGSKAQALVLAMMNHVLASGVPMEDTAFRNETFQNQTTYARHAELALLLVLAALREGDDTSEGVLEITWPDRHAAGNWLNRLRSQRLPYYEQSLALLALPAVSFQGQVLSVQDLEGANLMGANLSGAHLVRSSLKRSFLINGQLIGANLSGAHLEMANLDGANLEGAGLSDANLEGASLARAHLAGASLEGAYLAGAYLAGANLKGANLSEADLRGANLHGALLVGANLGGIDMESLRAWARMGTVQKCNITDVREAPEGFVEWALANGATEEW